MGSCQETHQKKRILILTLILSALETLFCTWKLLSIPADAKNAFLFGLSKERLLMTGVFAVLFLLNILALIRHQFFYRNFLQKKAVSVFLPVLLFISLFFCLLPDYRFGKGAAYYTRLHPFILWLFLTSLTFTFFCRWDRDRFSDVRKTVQNLYENKKFIFPVLAVLILGIVFVEATKIGKTVESSLWNKNGIPLESIQLFVSALIFIVLKKIGIFDRPVFGKRMLHFMIIWIASAVIWTLVPLTDHFFAPGPYEPNFEYYPYSDAIAYDIYAQTALNGWGFNHGRTFLKPAVTYITFLTHLATGNNFNLSMLLQSAMFAILPAVIYLFGSAIGGTGCGYLAAVFSILKEWNALNTHPVLTINSRLTMSEFFTQIVLAGFCYAVFRWLKKDGHEKVHAALAGGLLTLGVFTRYNFFAFLPAAMLIIAVSYFKNFRSFIKTFAIFIISILLTAAPVLIRESQLRWNMFSELSYIVNDILISRRFNKTDTVPEITDIPELQNTELVTENMDVPEFQDTELVTENTDVPELQETLKTDPVKTVPAATKAAAEPVNNTPVPIIEENVQSPPVSEKPQDFPEQGTEDFNTGQITANFSNNNSTKNLSVFMSIVNHSLHNFITSALTLPMEIRFHDLDHLYTQEGDGLWRDAWQGQFSAKQWILIGIWVLLGSVSIGTLIRVYGLAGFSILYFWLVYAFSTGFSRSSGGRYVVPCNWIPMLYLAYFCTLVSDKGSIRLSAEHEKTGEKWKTVFVLFFFTAIFTSMLIFEKTMPVTQTTAEEKDFTILQERLSDISGIKWKKVKNQIKAKEMKLTHGVALYPRFYYFRVGEHGYTGSLGWKDYSRLTFHGINAEGKKRLMTEYLLPHMGLIEAFPQDSIYRALSCRNENGYEDVLAVTIDTPDGKTYTYVRDPLPAFACPVPEPVCITIDDCR